MTWLIALILSWCGLGDAGGGSGAAIGTQPAAGGVTIPVATAVSADFPLPRVSAARGENPPLVVIDAGHGGHDPGASAVVVGVVEKNVTLALAIALHDQLVASGRVRVALTREDDTFLPLPQRYEIARRLGADLFISIHADASPDNDGARGATVYTLSEVASDREAAALAQRENEAGTIAGATLSHDPNVNMMLIDLAQRESLAASTVFANLVRREATDGLRLRSDWHRFAALIVLKAPDVPSILFESGYVTNREDVEFLNSAPGRRAVATSLSRAVEAYFARRFLRTEPATEPARPNP